MREELQKKIEQSIKLLQVISKSNGEGEIEVAYSGGKDSDVILQLAKEAGINYRAIYKNTTIDPPGTIKHVRDMGVEVISPKKSFFELIDENGLPNRWRRFCCSKLKEYKVLDKVIIGVRKAESRARAKRYSEPTQCRYFGKEHVEQIMPILDWTDEDVHDFIVDRNIKLAPVYYDEDGSLHTERRLGCMCCPLTSYRKRIDEFKKYQNIIKAYIRHAKTYMNNHPNSIISKTHNGNPYRFFYRASNLSNCLITSLASALAYL